MINLQKNEQELAESVMNKISLTKDKEKLEKHVVNLSKCIVDLGKKNNVDLGNKKARVVVVLDYSGSMDTYYEDGTVQRALNKLVPLGLTFDDNGSVEVYLFETKYRRFEELALDNYSNYVREVIETSGYNYGGTNYAPVLEAVLKDTGKAVKKNGVFGKLFKGKQSEVDEEIVFVLFITDGDNSSTDKHPTEVLIKNSSDKKVFIQFIGIGDSKFTFLEKLDDLGGRKVDNTGFSKLSDLDKVDDADLYNNVLGQFSEWLTKVEAW